MLAATGCVLAGVVVVVAGLAMVVVVMGRDWLGNSVGGCGGDGDIER